MEGVSETDVTKLTNNELNEIIIQKDVELNRFKGRFKDLVAAHKSLLKEKELLETSLSALTKNEDKSDKDSHSEKCTSEDFNSKLSTLMNSLAKLSEEKSKMEAIFQADKKQLRQEKIEAANKIKQLELIIEQQSQANLKEIENHKSKVIVERHQREKEMNDHAVMLRELQKLLAEERGKREKSDAAVASLNYELTAAHSAMQQSKKDEIEARSELEAIKKKYKYSNEHWSAKTDQLQQQLEQLKVQYLQTSQQEQAKIKDAEEKSRLLAAAHEERVANLEARLAELSLTVGQHDKLRMNDQLAIDKLKDRVMQLEMELGEEKSDLGLDDLKISLANLKSLIEKTKASEKPFDTKTLLREIIGETNALEDCHKQCKEDYDTIKEELDYYKEQLSLTRIKSTPSFKSENNTEKDHKAQINKLKERISNLYAQLEGVEKNHKKENEDHLKLLLNERRSYSEKINTIEIEWRKKVQSLEDQLTKQRERALTLVDEKEQELNELRESLNSLLPNRISIDKSTIAEGEGVVLHYTEELARRDVELSRLRKDKIQLDLEIRELKRELNESVANEQRISSLLTQQIERFEKCQSREGANLEYLKNVVLNFLLSNSLNSKRHMLNAIAAVLKFTEDEKSKIKQNSWWYKPQKNVPT